MHWSGDFENPEWQTNEDRLLEDTKTTLNSVKYAAVKTPGTSVTGPPPTSLNWTVPVKFFLKKLMLPDFEKPSPNRIQTVGRGNRNNVISTQGYYSGVGF